MLMITCSSCEMRRFGARDVDFRRMGQNKNKLVNITRKDGAIDLYFLEEKVAQPPGGAYLGGVLLAMCRWPLRTSTPL